MHNTFHLKRFLLLLKKTLLERPIQFFGFTGLMFAITAIVYAFVKSQAGFGPAQNSSFIWGLVGGGCFLASFVFNNFSSNAAGSSYLTLPASTLEKWLCAVVIAGVLYPLLFGMFFRGLDAIFVHSFHQSLDPQQPDYAAVYRSVYLFPFDGRVAVKAYQLYWFLAGAMLIGALYFNKMPFITTGVIIVLLLIGGFALNWFIAKAFFGPIENAGPFHHVSILVGKEIGSIDLPGSAARFFEAAVMYALPLLLWPLAFVRLREKEF